MKKTAIKKLQLKKGIVAQLNKENMNLVAGGAGTQACPVVNLERINEELNRLLTRTCGIYC